jgi:CheY-like chemotaxis protein/tetratricopeptide (TPR) repeat protein
MAQYVLIIEDEDSVGKAIAEVCTGLGLESSIAKRGADALAAFDARPADLVTLDLLLPGGMDGSKVAEQLRAKPAGAEVPIVVLSGFVKDPKAQADLQTKYAVKSILQKPLKADDLRAAIAGPLGVSLKSVSSPGMPAVQAGPPAAHERAGMDSFEADLRQRPPYAIFTELNKAKAEGVLELARGNAKKRFWLQRGYFRYATSNVKAENLAGLLPAKGVPEAKVNEGLQLAKANGISIPDALVQVRAVAQKDLAALLTQQTEEVAITAYQWPDGTATFKAGSADTNVEGRANPVICVIKGIKRFSNPQEARTRLAPNAKEVLERTPELDREMFALKGLFPGETVSPMVNGRLTLGDILAKAKEADLVLLYALVVSGLAKVKGAVAAAAAAAAAAASTPQPMKAVSKPNRPYTPEEDASRQLIAGEARRQNGTTTHYQVLGVAQNADAAAIKAAYLKLARTFHTDAFSGQELGEQQPALEQVFKRITEANAAIGDPKAREEYDTYMDRKAKGLPTDVGEILKADSAFSRAEAANKQGRLKDAEKLYREAVQLNPGEPNYFVALAKANFALKGKPAAKECLEMVDKALAMGQDSLPALTLKGQFLLELNQGKEALEVLRKVTSTSPGFENAMDLLKRAKVAAAGGGAEPEKGGLLGKLFGGKGK